jgi:transposase
VNDAKRGFLAREGLINIKPERVRHPLFLNNSFFDPRDLPQIRYEMLRTARVDGVAVAEACRLFGFSREYFYQREREFLDRGYAGLLGAPRGRTPLIARNQEIVNFILHRKMAKSDLTGEDLRQEVLAAFGVDCSRRTVERVIEKLELGKKGLHRS